VGGLAACADAPDDAGWEAPQVPQNLSAGLTAVPHWQQ
jgi:hypothetical protein